MVDINGNKGPNTYGKDLFFLKLDTKNEGAYLKWIDNDKVLNDCSKSLAPTITAGESCSYWILRHGNMDYLHRDLSTTEWNN